MEVGMLRGKNAAVFAAGGAVGGAVARAFARHGARLFLSGPKREPLETLARELGSIGPAVETSVVDACDDTAIGRWLADVESVAGRLDVVFNAIGIRPRDGGYGKRLADLSLAEFLLPLQRHAGSQFLTARAAARSMVRHGSGVILALSASVGRGNYPWMSGIAAASAAIEGLTRCLAAELGPHGVRVVCLCPGGILQTRTIRETVAANARSAGISAEDFTEGLRAATVLRRTPTLEEVGEVAAFLVSDAASALAAQTVTVTC
jgi:NAD(P)-dependent dehydrogenase (short-subunit alcohol dehydrogenase family)